MTVGKSLVRGLGLALLAAMLVLSCEGDDGPIGPPGFDGDDGDPGINRIPDPIATQVFGLLINNGNATDFQGALAVELTSDAAAVPSGTRVVARQLEEAPIIDGIDGGTDEWGAAAASDITIANVAAADLGITSASVRFAYNLEYIYMQIKWTEVESAPFVVAPDTTKDQWRAVTATSWQQSGGEDAVHLVWELTDIAGWDSEGAGAIFSGTNFATTSPGERADLWTWGSTVSYYGDFMQDRVIRDAAGDGTATDAGGPYVLLNDRFNNRPRYMRTNTSRNGSSYPLRDFEYTNFSNTVQWRVDARIPGYVYFEPARSAADILAEGKYEAGTWTVELQRKRNTGRFDDVLF